MWPLSTPNTEVTADAPESATKPAILWGAYAVVLFGIIVQTPTLGIVARRAIRNGGKQSTGPKHSSG